MSSQVNDIPRVTDPFFMTIILCWKSNQYLYYYLVVISSQMDRDFEIIGIDNRSPDTVTQKELSDFKNLIIYFSPLVENNGVAARISFATTREEGNFLVLITADAFLSPNAYSLSSDQPQMVRLISFYLPQFHPTPETLLTQAQLAQKYGIFGFCYYHYWFNGKQLLNQPLDEVLKSHQPDFPFCLCWANEDWNRTWDGRSKDILIHQSYSEEDDLKHIQWLAEVFKDKRYIRVDGKPLILIYRAGLLPNPLSTSNIWREEAKRLGIEDIYLCKVESFEEEHTDPASIGFDASVEFQPDWGNLGHPLSQYEPLSVYDYVDFVSRQINKPSPGYRRFPCVTPRWDNSPRKGAEGIIFTNTSPVSYEVWLRHAIRQVQKYSDDKKIVFINAWNEWGEGNHIEPDRSQWRQFLEATKRALSNQVLTEQLESLPYLKKSRTEIPSALLPMDNLADIQSAMKTYQDLSKNLQQKLKSSENEVEELRVKADHLEAQVVIQSRTLAPLGYFLSAISYLVIMVRAFPLIIRGLISNRQPNPFQKK